ncbi:hypothetical protein [Acidovorax sp. Root217]
MFVTVDEWSSRPRERWPLLRLACLLAGAVLLADGLVLMSMGLHWGWPCA